MAILTKHAIYDAAHDLMIMAVELELDDEDANCTLPGDTPEGLVECIIRDHADDVMLTMGIIIGKIENAWGHSIGLVFHHMDCGKEHSSLLYRLIMGCIGHGISLDDDGPSGPVATGFDNAGRILCNLATQITQDVGHRDTGKRFEAVPVHLDADCPIRELVSVHLVYEENDD